MNYRIQKPKSLNLAMLPIEVDVREVDFGKRPILWGLRKDFLILKIVGGMHWSGRGTTSYGPTYFQVCKILEEKDTEWLVEEIIDFPVRYK